MSATRSQRRLAVLLVVVVALSIVGTGPVHAEPDAHPNVVVILTDDQRWDSVDQMTQLDGAREWARFSNAFVDEPMCCPSRASTLTGRYPQHTGVETLRDGEHLDESRTIATMLHRDGYRTGMFGKYLNEFPFRRPRYVPPGWDRFVVFQGAMNYFNYGLNVDGHRAISYGTRPEEYSTEVLTTMGRTFIRDTKASQPFFLYLALNAPHTDARNKLDPAPTDRGRCPDRQFAQPPNFNAYDTVLEPAWMRAETPVLADNMVIRRAATCDVLQGVDDAVAAIVSELERAGRLKNTYLIFTSDNGYAFGEHRLVGKGDLYEASIRVPLLVRGPGIDGGTIPRLTSNVDLAPTILDWAGVRAPQGFLDGSSFARELQGLPTRHRPREVLLRGCRTGRDGERACGGNRSDMGLNWGLRTARYKYIEYPDGFVQLFDLSVDPWELTNLTTDPARAPLIAELHTRLERLRR